MRSECKPLCFLLPFFQNTSIGFLSCMQVIVSGKLRAARAKSMKFKDGYMVSSGQPTKEYIDAAVRHVLLRQVSSSQWKPVSWITFYLVRSCVTWIWLITCAGCAWSQGEDHAWLGPQGQTRTDDTIAWCCDHPYTERRWCIHCTCSGCYSSCFCTGSSINHHRLSSNASCLESLFVFWFKTQWGWFFFWDSTSFLMLF